MNCLLHLKKVRFLKDKNWILQNLYSVPYKVCIAGSSGAQSVCACTTHQNTILLVRALSREVTYKDLVNKVVCDPSNRECMMDRCTNCP